MESLAFSRISQESASEGESVDNDKPVVTVKMLQMVTVYQGKEKDVSYPLHSNGAVES